MNNLKNIARIFLLSLPGLYRLYIKIRQWKSKVPPQYPRAINNELSAAANVLFSAGWNMSYGKDLIHQKFESAFAEYIGTRHAVAVGSGGIAIQMLIRALGLKPGDEIIHQVDTCVANPFAILNAFVNPVFADISNETFMLSEQSVEQLITPRTKAIMPIHMWGNVDDMEMIQRIADKNKLVVIEDSCLSLGSQYKNKKTGSMGIAGVFSFGCLKPLQAGEGGMITTNDGSLAKELKAMRSWGDMSSEYGVRDQKQLSWNGRASEIVMAIAFEQFKKYPVLIERVQDNVQWFIEQVRYLDEIKPIALNSEKNKSSYTQVTFSLNESSRINKNDFFKAMQSENIQINHANFELLPSLSFFRNRIWKEWFIKGNIDFLDMNYSMPFPTSQKVYQSTGFGIFRAHFERKSDAKNTFAALSKCLSSSKK